MSNVASKLLGFLNPIYQQDFVKRKENLHSTLVVYGDDDIVLPSSIVLMHYEAHKQYSRDNDQNVAFGTRRITIGKDFGIDPAMELLEATGTISIRADALYHVSSVLFDVTEFTDACKFSDDYWISYYFKLAQVKLKTLSCTYDYHQNRWPGVTCGSPFHADDTISGINALSSVVVDSHGNIVPHAQGDWRVQLRRYAMCDHIIIIKNKTI
jgi:hypothetical protein